MTLPSVTQSGPDSVRLVDIASSGVASQSSLSKWSHPEGAQAAVTDDETREFAIHCGADERPWWSLDLSSWYPVEKVVIHNRRNPSYIARAKSLLVEVSPDGESWILLHSGQVFFGAGEDALVIPLLGQLPVRFLRLSLAEREPFHLSRVEVLVPDRLVRDRALMESVNVSFEKVAVYESGILRPQTYRLYGPGPVVSGLKLVRSGRFGNNVYQMSHALQLARRHRLDFVQMFESELFDFSKAGKSTAPSVLGSTAEIPRGATVVEGDFFYQQQLSAKFDLDDTARTAREILSSYLDLSPAKAPVAPDELVIHIRSGDIFTKPHPGYGQPPLAFYIRAVGRALSLGFKAVRIVAEDRLNPTIGGLEEYLEGSGVEVVAQIGEPLRTDLSTFLSARGLVFGVGTFGVSVCMLSAKAEVLFEGSKGNNYKKAFPHLDIYKAQLTAKYDPYVHWDNSPKQVEEMLAYPEDSIELFYSPASHR